MKCPICENGELKVCYLYQYSHIYKINKNGKISKKYIVEDAGTCEQSILTCSNGCNVNDYDWDIERDGKFYIDMNKKYKIYRELLGGGYGNND